MECHGIKKYKGRRMQKKITLAVICFCCLFQLGGCESDDGSKRRDAEYKANYLYEAFWYFQGDGSEAGESVPDEYSFLCRGKIYVYSVAAQEITQVLSSEDDQIDVYAINDYYIFL